jgi:hypothetical protein
LSPVGTRNCQIDGCLRPARTNGTGRIDTAVLAFYAIASGIVTAVLYGDGVHSWWAVGGVLLVSLVTLAWETAR